MSSEDRLIDPGATDQARTDLFSPARRDLMRDPAADGSRRHGPAARLSSDPRELPEKLIDAWSRWAASRLSQDSFRDR
jgi:hypothetical protein